MENTRRSFFDAWDAGASWVELDVMVTADGQTVLTHDVFGPDGPLWRQDRASLNMESLAGLADALPPGLGLNIEIKPTPTERFDPLDAVVEQVRRLTSRPVLISSFDPAIVIEAKTVHGLDAGWLNRGEQPLLEGVLATVRAGLDVVVAHAGGVLGEDPAEVHEALAVAGAAGLHLWAWDVEPHHTGRLLAYGFTGLCTDRVRAVSAIVNAHTPIAA